MAYNVIPTSLGELIDVHKDAHELTELYNHILKNFKINNPFAFDKSSIKNVKVIRSLQEEIDLKKFKTSFKLGWGNGSRGSGGSNNKGLLFERELSDDLKLYMSEGIDSVKKYKVAINDILQYVPKGYYVHEIKDMGELNQKRPLTITNTSITAGVKLANWDIGKTVTDISIICKNKAGNEIPLHLSLKMGGTVSFINVGVTKVLKQTEMQTGLVKDLKGKKLLELFDIDNAKFCAIFNSYTGKGSGKEEVDVTKHLKNSSLFKEFMKSVIGYGYILVHKIGSKVHVLDMTEKKMNSLISVKKATILYPKNGSAKRIDISIEMNGIKIKINLRNSGGKIYPSHIFADYILEH